MIFAVLDIDVDVVVFLRDLVTVRFDAVSVSASILSWAIRFLLDRIDDDDDDDLSSSITPANVLCGDKSTASSLT